MTEPSTSDPAALGNDTQHPTTSTSSYHGASSSPDGDRIMRDVRRLIMSQCGDNSPLWDHLDDDDDNSDQRRDHDSHQKRRGVRIADDSTNLVHEDMELLDIPMGLGLLFFAVQAEREKKATPNLLRLLLIAASPPPPEDPCHRLYVQHQAQLEKRQRSLDAITQSLLTNEMKECTFKPVVSSIAANLPGKGKGGAANFFAKCVEWKEHAAVRLAKKAERAAQEFEEETMQPWVMNEKSKRIAERLAARRQKEDPHGNSDAIQHHGSGDENSSPAKQHGAPGGRPSSPLFKFQRERQQPATYSFEPITNASRLRAAYMTGGSSPNRGASTSVNAGGGSSGNDTPAGRVDDGPAQTTASHIVQRLQEDIKAREVRAEERRKRFEALQKERLYDNETGQPLFQPNAAPTKRVGKGRVAFDQLPPDEQAALRSKLHKMGMLYVTQSKGVRSRSKQSKRSIEDIVTAMADRSKRAETHIEKIKRNELKEQTEWFKPKLEESSLKMAAHRVPPHKQDMPTKPPPPPAPKQPASDGARIGDMLQRNEQWMQTRKMRLGKAAERAMAEESAGCTFKPARANREALLGGGDGGPSRSHSPGSHAARSESIRSSQHQTREAELIAAAEVRMRNELELYRSHVAHSQHHHHTAGGVMSALLREPSNGGVGGGRNSASRGPSQPLQQQPQQSQAAGKKFYYEHASAEILQRRAPSTASNLATNSPPQQQQQHFSPSSVAYSPSTRGAVLGSSSSINPYSAPPPFANRTVTMPPPASSSLSYVDPMAALDAGVGELEQLLESWQALEHETDTILDMVAAAGSASSPQ